MTKLIPTHKPFLIYANCCVSYEGRAKSISERGNFLIIRKGDGTLIIHNNRLITPMNYQGPGSIIQIEDNILISTNDKDEKISIQLYDIIFRKELDDWCELPVDKSGTEFDLCEQIIYDIPNYIDGAINIHREYQTPVGPVDLVIVDDKKYNIIEVKRRKASVRACTQLQRYMEYFESCEVICKGILMAPDISDNARDMLEIKGYEFIPVMYKYTESGAP